MTYSSPARAPGVEAFPQFLRNPENQHGEKSKLVGFHRMYGLLLYRWGPGDAYDAENIDYH